MLLDSLASLMGGATDKEPKDGPSKIPPQMKAAPSYSDALEGRWDELFG